MDSIEDNNIEVVYQHIKKNGESNRHTEDQCECIYCSKIFSQIATLNRHMREVHKVDPADAVPRVKLQEQQKSYVHQNPLPVTQACLIPKPLSMTRDRKVSVAQDRNKLYCKSCSRTFLNVRFLKLHLKYVHNEDSETENVAQRVPTPSTPPPNDIHKHSEFESSNDKASEDQEDIPLSVLHSASFRKSSKSKLNKNRVDGDDDVTVASAPECLNNADSLLETIRDDKEQSVEYQAPASNQAQVYKEASKSENKDIGTASKTNKSNENLSQPSSHSGKKN